MFITIETDCDQHEVDRKAKRLHVTEKNCVLFEVWEQVEKQSIQ
jgi:hypothetical protein